MQGVKWSDENNCFDGFDLAYPKCPEKFSISMWNIEKIVKNEVDFLLAGTHESFP